MSHDDADDNAPYDNRHRAFLQALISHGILTLATAKPILAAIESAHAPSRPVLANDITDADLSNYLAQVHAAVAPFDMEVRAAYTQTEPRERVHALVNTSSDAPTQLATARRPDEIAYVKRLLDDMFERNNTPDRELCAVSGMQAARLHKADASGGRASVGGGSGGTAGGVAAGEAEAAAAAGAQSLSLREAEALLASLVAEGWLLFAADHYTLSARALMELRGWLLETYNEPADPDEDGPVVRVKECRACRDIVTVGQRCATRECLCRLHDHCARTYFRAQRDAAGGPRCPACRVPWTGKDFVGVRALRGAAGAAAGHRKSDGVASLRQRRGPAVAEQDSD